jgi:outer membrane receptor for ferric coprogen and ferric-rhodotorulic acid
VFYDVARPQEDDRVGERTLVNARLGYEADHWSLSLFANNLFDEHYDQYRNSFTGQSIIGAPRTVGIVLETGF